MIQDKRPNVLYAGQQMRNLAGYNDLGTPISAAMDSCPDRRPSIHHTNEFIVLEVPGR